MRPTLGSVVQILPSDRHPHSGKRARVQEVNSIGVGVMLLDNSDNHIRWFGFDEVTLEKMDTRVFVQRLLETCSDPELRAWLQAKYDSMTEEEIIALFRKAIDDWRQHQ